MLWHQKRGAICTPTQRDRGQKRLLCQDIAHSVLGHETVPRPAEAVCSRPHPPSHSAHGLRSAELHGAGPGRPPHARGQLHPGGLSAAGARGASARRRAQGWIGARFCAQSIGDPPGMCTRCCPGNWTHPGALPSDFPQDLWVTFNKMGPIPNTDTAAAFYRLRGCQWLSFSHHFIHCVLTFGGFYFVVVVIVISFFFLFFRFGLDLFSFYLILFHFSALVNAGFLCGWT